MLALLENLQNYKHKLACDNFTFLINDFIGFYFVTFCELFFSI